MKTETSSKHLLHKHLNVTKYLTKEFNKKFNKRQQQMTQWKPKKKQET
jgi:hypothetical protein